MPLTFPVKGGGGDFKTVPSGSHLAVCDMVVFLGLQPGSGIYPTPKHQLYVRFEIPAERLEFEKDGKKYNLPAVIGQTFTASMHEKANLRKQLEAWRGRKFSDDEAAVFDVSSILGKACMLNVIEKVSGDKVYANIASISQLPRGVGSPSAENPPMYYAPDDTACYSKLPDWIRKKLSEQIENKPAQRGPDDSGSYGFDEQPPVEAYDNVHGVGITDDDIPF